MEGSAEAAGEMSSTVPLDPLHQLQQSHITIPIYTPSSAARQPNLPSPHLIQGSREEYLEFGVPLYEASIKGDWKAAEAILRNKPELVRSAITENFETPLHIAASQSTKEVAEFVKNLVSKMEKKDLELQNKSHNTALSLAVTAGNVETTKIMVEKNKAVLEIPRSQGMMPLYVAALFAREKMARYLYEIPNSMYGDYWNDENRGWVLQKCVEADIFDVAVKIAANYPKVISNNRLLRDVLFALAKKADALKVKEPHMFMFWRTVKSIFYLNVEQVAAEREALELLRIIWKKIAIMPKKDIDDIIRGPPLVTGNGILRKTTYPSRALFVAAKVGNTRFIIELIRSCPDLIWKVDDQGLTIFHKAVKRRQADVYNLLYEIGSLKDLITPIKDKDGNNMLHLVGKSAKPSRFQNVSGVALQMQRELLWYKEVEQMIPPAYRERKNFKNESPRALFRLKHQDLIAEGEYWMKQTAPQCMVVATLIATIVFAAAFTLPGGYDQDTGIPTFGQKAALMVFVIADAISLISSSATVLIFLSIFTNGYAEIDFLESLPKMLMFGLATLFLSIVTMMVAFSASFFILYKNKSIWIPIMVTIFSPMPLFLFAYLQFRFLLDIFYATYLSKSLFKPKKHVLY